MKLWRLLLFIVFGSIVLWMILLSSNPSVALACLSTPTNTPKPTLTSTATSQPLPTPIPTIIIPNPVCESVDTGRVVNVLYMYNTNPLHFGYWDFTNGAKTGVCRIETVAGQFPNKAFIQQYCACDIPNFTWVTNRYSVLKIMEDCNGKEFLSYDRSIDLVAPWPFNDYCPSSKCTSMQ